MVRRSFRIGLRLGLLFGVTFALVKTIQSRRTAAAVPPPAPWEPIVDTPRPAPQAAPASEPVVVDEVGEPVMEPAPAEPALDVTPSTPPEEDVLHAKTTPAPAAAPAAAPTIEPGLDVVPEPEPPHEVEAPVKKVAAKKLPAAPAKKATAKKAAKKAATKAALPAFVEPSGGVCPPTHPVKAKLASRLFHLPGMFAYDRTRPDRCYLDADTAVADGFTSAKR
jgi:hypothetical protein